MPRTKLLIFFIISLVVLYFPKIVHAGDFTFDYVVTYDVQTNGTTHVTQKVTLTNNVTTIYAQNYSLVISSERLDRIKALDSSGAIAPQVAVKNGQTTILLPFNEKVVGINKQLPFTIEYDSYDIAFQKGRIWEIIIPGIEKNDEIRSYTIILKVPKSFGKAAYFTPTPNTEGIWTMTEHNGKGIAAAFGENQHFWFNLQYFLENSTNKIELHEITLPPDTAFQKILLSRISVPPDNVIMDADGNWLAQYHLQPKETREILVEGHALVYIEPRSGAPKQQLSESERKKYLKDQRFWEQTDAIKQKAKELKTAEKIYQYIVDTLQYDYSRVTAGIKRLGAKYAFVNPTEAVCMEFSDLFVAMSRAAGIPAREVHGFAYTANPRLQPLSLISDVLHAWPEYYDDDQQQWIAVDPTWGNTTRGIDYFSKLDFNHIAFAILGTSSDYPFPAGSFRGQNTGKDVFVDFSRETLEFPESTFTVELDADSNTIVSAVTDIQDLTIYNTGGVLYNPTKLTLSGIPNEFDSSNLKPIPPFGSLSVPVRFKAPLQFSQTETTLTVELDDKKVILPVVVKAFYSYYVGFITFVIILALGVSGILIYYAKRGY